MSRPEKAYAWRKKQGADAHNKIHKKKTTKNMTDNQQANLKEPSHSLHYTTPHSARTRACFWREAPPFSPRSHSYRESISSSSSSKILRAEGESACATQMACAKIRGRGRPSASQRERHLWVVPTLEMHTGRRLTCGTRSSIIAEVKNGFSAHRAPSVLPPGKCPSRARTPSSAFRVTVKRGGPKIRHHASGLLVA